LRTLSCVGKAIGYARCSSAGQNLDRQRDALKAAGADRLYEEKITGARRDRPQLVAMLDYARSGDVIVVTELARLGRTLTDLLDIVNGLGKRGIEFRSLKENVDTSTPSGGLIFHIIIEDYLSSPASPRPRRRGRSGSAGRRCTGTASVCSPVHRSSQRWSCRPGSRPFGCPPGPPEYTARLARL
jgi:hypothetical protein